MSQELQLPDPIYAALIKAAEASGTTPVGWIAAHLSPAKAPAASAGAMSLADLFAGRVGRIRTNGSTTASERCGEAFADHVERKRQEGHL